MSITVGVLALQGDVREHVRALTQLGVRTAAVRRVSELATVDGLVIPGGESTTMDKLLHLFDLADPLRARIAAGMPVFGSCAGMIMLADRVVGGIEGQRTLGGLDVTVVRNAFGRQVDSFEEDLHVPALRDGATHPVRAVFIRAPWVEQAGPDVQVLATVTSRKVGAVRHVVALRQGNLLATAFHPEVGGDVRFHEYFVNMVRSAAGCAPGGEVRAR
ncbi:pyridoxal 5'-phosphate synthase glutaminase subunit PdxT [Tessaracoccus antarcticus]|uniref:Pyridoxal 5'-phosphate synthase subunit PdxT n=1 Tax=Tessaracoccus antarcticus TaxID=2479848 RepID=A0A3M0GF37_9ACTN|nr:pyridoxal 5'-phosphate synthase glutaminase subunit PdxT [Tessaracoccus antarcticus]RMB60193.1 pyridoxal 5'-phosphate synthase glutaminase subunit PdxT [Tessaracoccus antarcticus]